MDMEFTPTLDPNMDLTTPTPRGSIDTESPDILAKTPIGITTRKRPHSPVVLVLRASNFELNFILATTTEAQINQDITAVRDLILRASIKAKGTNR